jgi:hypothetical protein
MMSPAVSVIPSAWLTNCSEVGTADAISVASVALHVIPATPVIVGAESPPAATLQKIVELVYKGLPWDTCAATDHPSGVAGTEEWPTPETQQRRRSPPARVSPVPQTGVTDAPEAPLVGIPTEPTWL